MTPQPGTSKLKKGPACKHCRERRRKCIRRSQGPCKTCANEGIECIPFIRPDMPLENTTRKRNQKEDLSEEFDSPHLAKIDYSPYHSELSPNKRATSSPATVSSKPSIIPTSQHKRWNTPRATRNDALVPQTQSDRTKNEDKLCKICSVDKKLRNESKGTPMIECQIPGCQAWRHAWCLIAFKDLEYILFSPETGLEGSIFICPDCVKTDKPDVREAMSAMSTFRKSIENLQRLPSDDPSAEIPESPNGASSPPARSIEAGASAQSQPAQPPASQSQHFPQQPVQERHVQETILNAEEERIPFNLAREEKFQGYNKSEVDFLMRSLGQSIFNYDMEIREVITRFGRPQDEWKACPLKSWDFVDRRSNSLEGQEWYHDDQTRNQSGAHESITAALRNIFNVPLEGQLEIDPSQRDLSFSHVHIAFVWWFVFDVLLNKLSIFELPNMKPLRIMMSAISNYGEATFPSEGINVLQEVQLRTWYKTSFQNELLQNKDSLKSKFDAYMQPLTRDFDQISKWSHHKDDIIITTIKLWSYFSSLRGKFEEIQPRIGAAFDEDSCERDGQDDSLDSSRSVRHNVPWIVRRGFRYYGMDGQLVVTKKAVVVIKEVARVR